jgi:hypothetical protein
MTMITNAKRSLFVAAAALATILLAGITTSAADRMQSGLQPGEPISTIFEPLNVTGPFAGEPHCMVCENGANPVAMIFARDVSAPLLQLLTKLDAATARHAKQEMGSFVVFLSDDANLPERLKAAAEKHALKHVVLTTFEPAGPEGFKVAPGADVTVVLYTDHQVKANHAFRKGELNDKATAKILADLPKIVNKP